MRITSVICFLIGIAIGTVIIAVATGQPPSTALEHFWFQASGVIGLACATHWFGEK